MSHSMYIMNPRRARHLSTLRSISGALYNMDQSQIEAANYEAIRQCAQLDEMRAQLDYEASKGRRRAPGAEVEDTIIPFPGQPGPRLEGV